MAAGYNELLAYVQAHGTLYPNRYPDHRLPVEIGDFRILKAKPVTIGERLSYAAVRVNGVIYRVAVRTSDMFELGLLQGKQVILNAFQPVPDGPFFLVLTKEDISVMGVLIKDRPRP